MTSTSWNPVCGICYETIIEKNSSATDCGHIFHTKCIDSWFATIPSSSKAPNLTCPQCRQNVRDLIPLELREPPEEEFIGELSEIEEKLTAVEEDICGCIDDIKDLNSKLRDISTSLAIEEHLIEELKEDIDIELGCLNKVQEELLQEECDRAVFYLVNLCDECDC